MEVSQIHNRYYSKNARGYYIIKKFYSKYKNQLESTSNLHLNDFLHEIYLTLHKIDKSNIVNNDVNYILSAIHVKCRALLYNAKNNSEEEKSDPVESNRQIEETSNLNRFNDLLNSMDSESAQQFLYQLSLFRLTIKDKEILMLNALIDGKSESEIAEEHGLTAEALNTIIQKLKNKFTKSLKSAGISLLFANTIFNNQR